MLSALATLALGNDTLRDHFNSLAENMPPRQLGKVCKPAMTRLGGLISNPAEPVSPCMPGVGHSTDEYKCCCTCQRVRHLVGLLFVWVQKSGAEESDPAKQPGGMHVNWPQLLSDQADISSSHVMPHADLVACAEQLPAVSIHSFSRWRQQTNLGRARAIHQCLHIPASWIGFRVYPQGLP